MFWGLFAPLLLGIGSVLQYRKQMRKIERLRKKSLENPSILTDELDP